MERAESPQKIAVTGLVRVLIQRATIARHSTSESNVVEAKMVRRRRVMHLASWELYRIRGSGPGWRGGRSCKWHSDLATEACACARCERRAGWRSRGGLAR